MSAGRQGKDLIGRRRRAGGDSDGEEDALSVGGDSQSEGSVAPQDQHDNTAPVTDSSQSGAKYQGLAPSTLANGASSKEHTESASSGQAFPSDRDTRLMLGGIGDSEDLEQKQVIDYNELPGKEQAEGLAKSGEGQRGAQDQTRQRRGADPTFIPSRGNFFMHDARASDQRGYAGFGRGRGRGRPFNGGPFSHSGVAQAHPSRLADAPWAHDLHEAIIEPEQRQFAQQAAMPRTLPVHPGPAATARAPSVPEYRPYSFSTSKTLGKVQVRVSLPEAKAPIAPTGVLITQYTRLPDHRPPLRRDKAVRISLPDRPPSYVMPSAERSFIFIPRAMRPNQQGLGRRVGPASRRTSVYGGSVYTPSIAASRRSSTAREIGREFMFSPTGSAAARHLSSGRPVVRLPQGISQPPSVVSPAGSQGVGGFPLPQTPAIEHYRETATMHQPRPQKAIQVSGIESPAAMSMHAPRQQDQQPFENQLPHHTAEGSFGSSVNQDASAYYAYQNSTPLSHIPERAIHAQPFQPPSQRYGQAYYGQQPGFYYQPVPMYMAQSTPRTTAVEQDAAAGMMAHESNGMVYYVDPTQMQSYGQQGGYSGQEGYVGGGSGYGMVNAGQESGWYYPNVASDMYYPQQ